MIKYLIKTIIMIKYLMKMSLIEFFVPQAVLFDFVRHLLTERECVVP